MLPSCLKMESSSTNLEIIVGTYEEILLAYRVKIVAKKWQVEESFTGHSHLGSIKHVAVSKRRGFLASGGTDETIWLYSLKSRRLIGSLTQHSGSVTHLQFHQGSHLFSCSEDGTLCLWKAFTWECLRSFKGHKDGINCVAVHPSGKLALTVSKDKTLRAWNLLKGRPAYVTNLYKVADSVLWSPSADNYILVFGNKIEVYKTENAALTRIIEAPGRINAVVFVSDTLIAFGGESSEIEFYNLEKDCSQHKINFSSPRIRGLCFKKLPSKQEVLISGSSDGFIRIWSVAIDPDGIIKTECLMEHNTTFRLTSIDAFVSSPNQPTDVKESTIAVKNGQKDEDDEEEEEEEKTEEEEEQEKTEEEEEDKEEEKEIVSSISVKSTKHSLKKSKSEDAKMPAKKRKKKT